TARACSSKAGLTRRTAYFKMTLKLVALRKSVALLSIKALLFPLGDALATIWTMIDNASL
ncbi:MAG: hypothetical protein AB7G75_17640, partial [Candidatus Binatia bacterium]